MSHLALQTPVVIVSAICAVAAVLDTWKFRVPNRLTLSLLGTGLLFHCVTGGASGLVASFSGAAFGFSFLIGIYAAGGMGAGDVKLGAAVGAWLGTSMTFQVLIAASLAGGAYALVLIVGLRVARLWGFPPTRSEAVAPDEPATSGVASALRRPDRRLRVVPFGAMIAVGLLIVVLRS